jgi:LPXTG-motif cell wall-anchored protein
VEPLRTLILTLTFLFVSLPVTHAAPLDVHVDINTKPVTDTVNQTVQDVTDLVRPADQPPTDQPPVVQPPVDQPPVDQPPVVQPPVDDPPVDQPPVVQPPVDQPPVDQPPVVQPPADQPPANQPPANQPPANQPPANQPPDHESPVDQPADNQPNGGGQQDSGHYVTVDKPSYSAPTVVQPEEIQQLYKSIPSQSQPKSQELPKTATPYPNLALAGGLLLVFGVLLYRFRPKKG